MEDVAQHRVADGAVGRAMKRGEHRHRGRIPRDRAAPADRQLSEAVFKFVHELAVKPELDRTRAVNEPSG